VWHFGGRESGARKWALCCALGSQESERTAPGKPSPLAERVANAFRSAATDAVRQNRERGNPVVG